MLVAVVIPLVLCLRARTSSSSRRRSLSTRTYPDPAVDDERELIVGGSDADPTEFPFFIFSRFGQRGGCGGTLIHRDIVLTAAHCEAIFEGRGLTVGATSLENSGEFFEDDALLVHPAYDRSIELNDIMLVKLDGFSDAPVVQINVDPSVPVDEDAVTVVGLGRTSPGGDLAQTLQEVDVQVVNFEECSAYWEGFLPIGNERQICAGTDAGGRDACQGDSGGPMFDSMGRQIGIVSVGDGCGQPAAPAVYTRVSAYADFIRDGICTLSFDPPGYCSPTISPTNVVVTPAPTLIPVQRPGHYPRQKWKGKWKRRSKVIKVPKSQTVARNHGAKTPKSG